MYSISHDHALFEKYALPIDEAYPMPTARTVVSVKRDGSPASYFEDDAWDFNDLFNTKNEVKSNYTLKFHAQKHNPKLLLEFKQRMYWLIWGGKETLLSMEGKTFRKLEQIREIQIRVDLLLRVFANTSINVFSYISSDIVFSQIKESLRGESEKTITKKLGALSVLVQVNSHFPESVRFHIPYQEGETARKIAKTYAAYGKGHYPTVIPVIYEQYLCRLIQDVESAYLDFLGGRDLGADVEAKYRSLLSVNDIEQEIETLYQELIVEIEVEEKAKGKGISPQEVLDDYRDKAKDEVESIYRSKAHKGVIDAYKKDNVLLDVKAYAQSKGLTENQATKAFRMIEGTCFGTCSAFTGMRMSELTQIDGDSYKEVDIDGVKLCTMRSWTDKLEKLSREDTWACAPICEKALLILTVLNDKYRSVSGDIHLSPRFSFKRKGWTGDTINRQLKDAQLNTKNLGHLFYDYSLHIDIRYLPEEMDEVFNLLNPIVHKNYYPIQKNGHGELYWRFNPHSLRRTFAHFVVGHGLVSLASLKHQFKHIHLAMTAIYASHSEVLTLLGIQNPAEIKEKIQEKEIESHAEYLKDMIEHPEEQSGGFMKFMSGEPMVVGDARFNQLVEDTKGANKSTGFGTCFSGELCSMGHLFEPSKCVGRDCENLNVNKAEAENWVIRRERCIKKIEKMKEMEMFNRSSLATQLSDIRAAEKVMADHNIQFEKYRVEAL
ncbi:integrase [Vibrio parahaemolyticus]|uniref:integrase n=1 Tax=Vibrio parahaemolyticus TaxID=670 RepID=UPI00084AA035|nr:integrase [Vibrio parahaemolyticus]EGR3353083.1 integrase [Vibrio parahaemolyticus]EJG1850804.1 site-specific integrase [Vibrio parahaemolyticus]ODZ77146.1 integrase [Vibrio parahaemolyticus]OEA17871.1 integrase [Vibrio parahaemolyticus]